MTTPRTALDGETDSAGARAVSQPEQGSGTAHSGEERRRVTIDELKLARDGHLGFGPSWFAPGRPVVGVDVPDYGDDDWDAGECCWECHGEGGWHDCGEDCCCCLDKDELTEVCPTCHGTGYAR